MYTYGRLRTNSLTLVLRFQGKAWIYRTQSLKRIEDEAFGGIQKMFALGDDWIRLGL
jgi:hypothetical protein